MNFTIITPPPFLPVTLAEVWEHLRMDPEGSPASTPLDATLLRNMATATQFVEQRTGRSLIRQQLRATFSAVPDSGKGLVLPRPPVLEVVSAGYYSDPSTFTPFAGDWYVVEDGPKFELFFGTSPIAAYARPDAVRVVYWAGYAPDSGSPMTQAAYAANVPTALKDAVLITVEMLSGNTGPEDKEALENSLDCIIGQFHIPVLA